MSLQDPVADMLTCIRNAQKMGIQKICMPHSRLKTEILKVLKDEGFVGEYEVLDAGNNKKKLQVLLKYHQGTPVIEKIDRVSRPALRIYKGYDQIPLVRGGLGIAIVSTPKGVMSDKAARANKV